MITLRLFKSADPFQELQARRLRQGEVTIGRDPELDWVIDDPSGTLSRRHCTFGADGERVWLRDGSTNGVFIGAERFRAPRGETRDVEPGDTIYLGDYMILVDPDPATEADEGIASDSEIVRTPAAAQGPCTDAALLESFCRAARLEASSFAGEDPVEVMARLGKSYRRIIDDLSGLMSDRAHLKDSLAMEQTSIGARDNNPLKWMKAEKVAVDLLKEGEGSFLKGAAAFAASFSDLRRHGACLLAGSRTAVRTVLEELDPGKLMAEVKRDPLTFTSKFEIAWRHFSERHAELASDEAGRGLRKIDRAFREGYEMQAGAYAAAGDEC